MLLLLGTWLLRPAALLVSCHSWLVHAVQPWLALAPRHSDSGILEESPIIGPTCETPVVWITDLLPLREFHDKSGHPADLSQSIWAALAGDRHDAFFMSFNSIPGVTVSIPDETRWTSPFRLVSDPAQLPHLSLASRHESFHVNKRHVCTEIM
jgi:hypothetical protein